jgi:hypothetical protein
MSIQNKLHCYTPSQLWDNKISNEIVDIVKYLIHDWLIIVIERQVNCISAILMKRNSLQTVNCGAKNVSLRWAYGALNVTVKNIKWIFYDNSTKQTGIWW